MTAVATVDVEATAPDVAGPARRSWRPRPGTPGLVFGLVVITSLLLAAWFLPLRYDPLAVATGPSSAAPDAQHWFGTDSVGADQFARVVSAARTDLPLALGGTALAMLIGVAGGLLASARGPWGERFMRLLDTFQALPLLVITVALVAISGNDLSMVVVAIALISGPFSIRLVRGQALSLRESRFVEAAVAAGSSPVRIMVRHLLPNLRSLILAQTALTAANALLVVAALSFIGVGVQVPTPSWGSMVQQGGQLITVGQWWLSFFPAVSIFLCVLAFNLIANGLRDRSAGRRERS